MPNRLRLTLLAAATALAAIAPAAAEAKTMPCVPGQSQPRCSFQNAKVTFIADGDTINVRMAGSRAVKRIRFTGINAMELTRYSKYRNRRRGACHGVEATNFIERYIKRSHNRVRLADQRNDSRSGERLRRAVWVKSGGRWKDLGKMELQKGLVLWLPNGVEWAHNAEYHRLAAEAAAAQRGLYDPDSCGAGPDAGANLRMWVNWDADGNDGQNLDDEYVQIVNDGASPVSLKGWWVRDSFLHWARRPGGPKVPGYPFEDSASIPAGGAVRLRVGCGNDTDTQFFWCLKDQAFENVTTDGRALGDGAYLFDPQGDLRKSFIYACVIACSDPALGRARVDIHPNNPESVSVTNTGVGPLDLYGYLVKLHNPNADDSFIASYPFGQGAVLGAGETLRIDIGGSPSNDSRLVKHWGLGANVLRDAEAAASLRTFSDIVIDCDSAGRGRC
ncbi:MAG: competence protein ComEC [Thermoleophilaceae bacterium]|jgi:endonuclease YncB( thermonuclease family)|nr:competence protein ComEC [Thermoleophilaceae bacterium]